MKQPFEQIVQTHGLSVLRICRALLDEHRAQDAWSETFLSALKAYPELDPEANVRAWLVRIAHNKAIDELRRYRREALGPEVGTLQLSTEPHPDKQMESLELWQVVKQLPQKQRLVIAYRYLGGLDYRQVAQILGGTADAARRAASDGIGSMRQMIGTDKFPGGEL